MVYRRHLPHWRQDGCAYFVTFRLKDSIPRSIIEHWIEDRNAWYRSHGLDGNMDKSKWNDIYRSIPEKERRAFERDQIAKPLRELDRCHGACVFRDKAHAELLKNALLYFDGDRVQCGDFIVMPNHVHWIVMPLKGYALEILLKSIKGYVSTRLGKMHPELKGSLWQSEFYDRCIRDREELARIRVYIADNPAFANISEKDYVYHRADWLDIE